MKNYRFTIPYRFLAFVMSIVFSVTLIPAPVFAQKVLDLPVPGMSVSMSAVYQPLLIKGLNIDPHDPMKIGFVVDQGDFDSNKEDLKKETTKLIKYFLASLTIPEKEMWVNLSPYEKNRIIPAEFGQTEMGRDLLAQDYMLKQLSATLMHPDEDLGQAFWDHVFQVAQEKFDSTELPVNTFNKIWIVPEKAKIYESETGGYILSTHLKVMLEEDYLALEANQNSTEHGLGNVEEQDLHQLNDETEQIYRTIIIPEIEREVNEGKTFAPLRQIYHSVLLASWYKKTLRESLLSKVYVDQHLTEGVDVEDKGVIEDIYQQYIDAFRKGTHDIIREDYDPVTQDVIQRKYFSGGIQFEGTADFAQLSDEESKRTLNKVLARSLMVSVLFSFIGGNAIGQSVDPTQVGQPGNAGAEVRTGLLDSLKLINLESLDSINDQQIRAAIKDGKALEIMEKLEQVLAERMDLNDDTIRAIAQIADSDPNEALRWAAFKALDYLNVNLPEVVNVALKHINHPNDSIRNEAVTLLGNVASVGDTRTIDALIGRLSENPHDVTLLQSLGKVGQGNARALSTLIRGMNEKNTYYVADILMDFQMGRLDADPFMEMLYERLKTFNDWSSLYQMPDIIKNIGIDSPVVTKMVKHMFIDTKKFTNLGSGVKDWILLLVHQADAGASDKTNAKNVLNQIKQMADGLRDNVYQDDMQDAVQGALVVLEEERGGYQEGRADRVSFSTEEFSHIDELIAADADINAESRYTTIYPQNLRSTYGPEAQNFPDFKVYQLGNVSTFVFLDLVEQRNTLDRIGIFREHHRYAGKILSVAQMQFLYEEERKNQLYTGHDYRLSDIADFFNTAKELNVSLLPEEMRFRDALLSLGMLREENGSFVGDSNRAIITYTLDVTPEMRSKVLKHEISHALYFVNEDYRKEVARLWDALTQEQKQLVKSFLLYKGYNVENDEELAKSEYAAYLQDGYTLVDMLNEAFNDNFGGVGEEKTRQQVNAWRDLRQIYDYDGEKFFMQGILEGGMRQEPLAFFEQQHLQLNQLLYTFLSGKYYANFSEERPPELPSFEASFDSNVTRMIGGVPMVTRMIITTMRDTTVGELEDLVLNTTMSGLDNSAAKRRVLKAIELHLKDKGSDVRVQLRVTGNAVAITELDAQGKPIEVKGNIDDILSEKGPQGFQLTSESEYDVLIIQSAENADGYSLDTYREARPELPAQGTEQERQDDQNEIPSGTEIREEPSAIRLLELQPLQLDGRQEEIILYKVDQGNLIDVSDQGFLFESEKADKDEAMLDKVGGIDFNPENIDVTIEKEGKGFNFVAPQQNQTPVIEKINGITPTIINITPINSLPLLLGRNAGEEKPALF